jgi:4-hydroxy-tetrahydrodipicolinate reductase
MQIALIGYGKMGKEIEKIALTRGHRIALIIDKDNATDLDHRNLKNVDVAIEFSTPDTALENFKKCFASSVPVVSGTTGWLNNMEFVAKECENGQGFFYASNFSLGVNVFFEINKRLAQLMQNQPDYTISMEEIHHTQKLDSPSGTAISLANDIISEIETAKCWSEAQTNDPSCIHIEAKRITDTPGTHTVKYSSQIDDIEIMHKAHNRRGFALGAVLAAEFMANKKGFYGMKDLLNF